MSEQVVVRCPQCAQKYRVPLASVGHHGHCKLCHTRFRIAAGPKIDDDTIFAWISEDDPSSGSVAGSTGIFSKPLGHPTPAPVFRRAEAPQPAGAVETKCEAMLRMYGEERWMATVQ